MFLCWHETPVGATGSSARPAAFRNASGRPRIGPVRFHLRDEDAAVDDAAYASSQMGREDIAAILSKARVSVLGVPLGNAWTPSHLAASPASMVVDDCAGESDEPADVCLACANWLGEGTQPCSCHWDSASN